jgi:predicted  nucleic acid-binding Zn-ribbon protein
MEWLFSTLAIAIAIVSLILSIQWRQRDVVGNEIKHIHQRINAINADITKLRERLASIERDVKWLKERSNR